LDKKEIRQQALERMKALPQPVINERSRLVILNLRQVPEFAEAKGVLTCLSFRQEVNTWPLVKELAADPEREVYVPRADRGDPRLHVHRYPCPLETLKIGLQQPPRGEPELPPEEIASRIDAALVLGVLFDRHRGYRLGYGGGYFDRFLAQHRLFSIGLAFECQMVESLPVAPHDIPMSVVVTEDEVYRFRDVL
jgi:5-formyltetrahydrofolate cyclo-ligase